MSQSDDQGRSETPPPASAGGAPYGDPGYGQQFATPASYGQHHPGPYGWPEGHDPEYRHHGTPAAPARPGGVVTAAVLGFLFGALGALVSVVTIVVGAVASAANPDVDEELPGIGSVAGFIGGTLVVVGLLALLWTVVMIWGSVWALTGRSRVLLLVGGSIAVALTLIGVLGIVADPAGTGAADVVVNLLFLLAAVAIVILLATKRAAAFFAAHRYQRTGR